MQSQLQTRPGPIHELLTSSKQQPGSLPRRRPVGVEPGIAVVALAALTFALTLCYAAACTITTQNGYAAMALRADIEDVRSQNALLRYQINIAQATPQVEAAATGLGLHPADAVQEVDYVTCPAADRQVQLAAGDPSQESEGLRATLARLAARVVDSMGTRAEASTVEDHRP